MVLLLFFKVWDLVCGRTDGQSRDNQNFWDRWVTKFSKVWGSARAPLACRGPANIITKYLLQSTLTRKI